MATPAYPQMPTSSLAPRVPPQPGMALESEVKQAFGNLGGWLRYNVDELRSRQDRLLQGDTDGFQFSLRSSADSPENGALRYGGAGVYGTDEGFYAKVGGSWHVLAPKPTYWSLSGNILHPTTTSYDVALGGNSSAAPLFVDAGLPQVRVNANLTVAGKVGIGTTTPFSELGFGQVVGKRIALYETAAGAYFYGMKMLGTGVALDPYRIGIFSDNQEIAQFTAYGGYSQMRLENAATGANCVWNSFSAGAVRPYMGTVSNHDFHFITNNVYRWGVSAAGGIGFGATYYAIDAGQNNVIIEGNLGVGTSSPGSRLVVKFSDAAGTDKFSLLDSGDVEVASIDSNGNIQMDGALNLGGTDEKIDRAGNYVRVHARGGASTPRYLALGRYSDALNYLRLDTDAVLFDFAKVVRATAFWSTGEVHLDGDINHDGSNIGFFGATPVAQQAHIADASTSHDMTGGDTVSKANLDAALDALGAKINAAYLVFENLGLKATS